eukprot:CAMPEP_0116547004 /NCGR_PEP_ID=MMETSP0397-20121206/3541_1 /TAXON_ID=216820 /ORGANISM="Cyclophora tenuis, Strain ECT3854" /LENGTH=56 /DNA_ID=CAMNT_0004071497 /DNA_START=513 /DNA_END=680 /DNA_ORIENTATION=-
MTSFVGQCDEPRWADHCDRQTTHGGMGSEIPMPGRSWENMVGDPTDTSGWIKVKNK